MKITESQNGLEGTLKLIWFQPPALGRDTFHQTRLLRVLCNLALNTAREGAATASLGNRRQGLTTLRTKNFFLLSNLNLLSLSVKLLSLILSLHALVKSQMVACALLKPFFQVYAITLASREQKQLCVTYESSRAAQVMDHVWRFSQ